MKTKWILQTNIFKEKAVDKMINCFERQDLPYDLVKIIPFADCLPEGITDHDGPVLAYGTTTLLKNIVKSGKYFPGMWFNEETFKPSVWGKQYGEKWLNHDSKVMKIYEVLDHFDGPPLFIRPNSDFKLFSGDVFDKYEFEKWYDVINDSTSQFKNITIKSEVTISSVKDIWAEWRFVVIDKEVVTGSMYKKHNMLYQSAEAFDMPINVIEFALSIARADWQVEKAYTLDICQTVDGLKVIEVNCFNASGFYECDVMHIIAYASEFAKEEYERLQTKS